MATNTKIVNTTATTNVKTNVSTNNNIEKIIQDNTPNFVSKNFTLMVNNLESFRVNHFNSVYIFYPILIIVLFIILRYLWRKFF